MFKAVHVSFVTALTSLACLSSVAAADETKPASSTKTGKTQTTSLEVATPPANADKVEGEDKSAEHLKGLELTLRPSFGGAPADSPVHYQASPTATLQGDIGSIANGTASPYGSGFVGQVMLGYRFHPIVSAGLRAGMRNASASSLSDGTTDLTRKAWDAGFYVRAYPLALTPSVRKHLDPWVGVGAGYLSDTQSYVRSISNVPADMKLEHHAVAVPLGIGVDYRVHPMISIGPSFEYTLANSVAGCLKATPKVAGGIETSYCSNEGVGKQFIKADSYGVWTAGLDLRATLF